MQTMVTIYISIFHVVDTEMYRDFTSVVHLKYTGNTRDVHMNYTENTL